MTQMTVPIVTPLTADAPHVSLLCDQQKVVRLCEGEARDDAVGL